MSYISSKFIFFVFAGLLVSSFLPARFRNLWLIGLSLCWLATWNYWIPLIVGALVLVTYFCMKWKQLWPLVVAAVATLIWFRVFESRLSVGSSFYVLILLACAIDVVTRKSEELNLEETFLLGSFFPLMMAGPVERGEHFKAAVREARISWESVFDGALIFSVGFLKYRLLNHPLATLSENFLEDKAWWMIGSGALISILNLYISLSSFADMGRGVARMFGIIVPPSFRPVFFARDPSDFWERWNRTVASWFRDYLVFPSLLRWGRKVPANLIVFFAFITLGLWHGFDLEWLIFGIFNGLMVIAGSLLKKVTHSPMTGRVLVMLLFVGNSFIYIGDRFFDTDEPGPFDILTPWTAVITSKVFFFSILGAFFLLEWFQEKKKDNDFYLAWPRWTKRTIVIILLILWIVLVNHREPVASDRLPLYFEL